MTLLNLLPGGAVGLGTFAFTGRLSPITQAQATEVMDAYVTSGGRYLETAPRYANPDIDLAGLLKRYKRDELVLATKCVVGSPGEPVGYARAMAQFRAEAARLDVDRIDVVQVRVLDPAEDVAGALKALSDLRRTGHVRWIGLSRVPTSSAFASLAGGVRVDLLQNRLSMLHRGEHRPELTRFCQRQGIALNPCQVLERGQLCETTADPPDRGAADIRRSKADYNGPAHQLVRHWVRHRLARLAHAGGLTTEQLSIGWALSQPGVAFCVVGAGRPEQIRRAVAAPARLPSDLLARVETELLAFEHLRRSGDDRRCS